MNYTEALGNAVNYIENNLTGRLDLGEIARRAGFSPFYFQRIFTVLCGCPLGEYIRNRRLALAGSELAAKDVKVIDMALKYGYDSPESFTRAFVKFHGITPSQAKKSGSELKSFSRLFVEVNLKGGRFMNYKIVKKEAFKVLEKVSAHEIDDSKNKNTIPDFWTKSHNDGTVLTLLKVAADKKYIFGICYGGDFTDQKTFNYSIAAVYNGSADIPAGFRINEIPARMWAVFECKGAMPLAMQETWHKILAEFFPAAKYEPTCEMDIEVYPPGDMTSPDYCSEIWVPVKEK